MTSYLEEAALKIMVDIGISMPVREYQFCKDRKWRFDFAWPERMIAVEIEGGHGGRHQRYYGYQQDCDKYNRATLMGWKVYRFTKKHLSNQKDFDELMLEIFDG